MSSRLSGGRVVLGGVIFAIAICVWTVGRAADDPGEPLYDRQCSTCHGPEGRGRGTKGPPLIPFEWSYEEARHLIRQPVCDMPPISESALSDADIAKIVAYLKTIK